ncbi:MAG: rhodanese-like domain-containing protein [Candidatus Asgardarchaeia archaeon]
MIRDEENKEDFKLVDVLSEDDYKRGHIPGAINIPLEKLEKLADKYLKKKDKIVVYCTSYSCHASTNAAKKLLRMGYRNVLDFKAGRRGWVDAGFGLKVE